MARYPGNFTDSDILNVPRKLKTRSYAPETKLAYITPKEEGILQALKPGTPHRGPKGIPNYDTWGFDPDTGAVTGGSTAGGGGAWSGDPGGGQPEPQPWGGSQGPPGGGTATAAAAADYANSVAATLAANPELSESDAANIWVQETLAPGGGAIENVPGVVSTLTPGVELYGVGGADEGIGLPGIVNENIIQPVIGGVGDFWNKYMSGSLLTAPWKMLRYPKARQFTSQNDLAIIRALLSTNGVLDPEKIAEYERRYGDIIEEGLAGTGGDEAADVSFEEALMAAPELGVPGEESQRRLDKVSFYEDQISPQTTGGLEQLAGETTFTGENLTQAQKDFNQKVFDSRQELDRRKRRHDGGGQGIADLSPVAQLAATTPEEVPAEVAAATTTPAATTTAMTTPTPFDYSQWPQFTSAYPGYNQYPGPNYVNQGLGQGPNFDYWNQIANAYPGMGNYG